MPGFDRTGPEGQGPQSGKRMGRCSPDNQNQSSNSLPGRALRGLFRRGKSGNKGFRHGNKRGNGRGFGRKF
jgi:hypothetical protein